MSAFITYQGREFRGKSPESITRTRFGKTAKLVASGDRSRFGGFYRANVVKGGAIVASVIVKG